MGEFNIMNCIVMVPSIKFRFFGSCSSEPLFLLLHRILCIFVKETCSKRSPVWPSKQNSNHSKKKKIKLKRVTANTALPTQHELLIMEVSKSVLRVRSVGLRRKNKIQFKEGVTHPQTFFRLQINQGSGRKG